MLNVHMKKAEASLELHQWSSQNSLACGCSLALWLTFRWKDFELAHHSSSPGYCRGKKLISEIQARRRWQVKRCQGNHDHRMTFSWRSCESRQSKRLWYVILWWCFHTELLSLAGHGGTLWQWRVSNSNVLGLHPFAAHLTDASGGLPLKSSGYMKGPEDAYLRFLLLLYDCWFYVFSMMTGTYVCFP